jgi:hypothetical protein
MTEWMRRVLESKRAARQRLRQLPFSEKLKLLEKLRERSLLMHQARTQRDPDIPFCHRRPSS